MRICETQRSESKNREMGEEDEEGDQTNSARAGTKRKIYQTCIIGPRFC